MRAFPSISIVVIARDDIEFLPACIASISGQKVRGVELLVVDLGSRDGSRELLHDYAARGVIDRLLDFPGGNPAAALNEAFRQSSGELQAYVCADDTLISGAIAYVRRFFGTYREIDILCARARSMPRHDAFPSQEISCERDAAPQQTTFYRRLAFESAGGFNENNRVTWGSELLADMALSGARVASRSKILGAHRVRGGQLHWMGARWMEAVAESNESLKRKLMQTGVSLHSRTRRTLLRCAEKLSLVRHPDPRLAS